MSQFKFNIGSLKLGFETQELAISHKVPLLTLEPLRDWKTDKVFGYYFSVCLLGRVYRFYVTRKTV